MYLVDLGNNWYESRCYDKAGKHSKYGSLQLGFMTGTTGKELCLAACRTYSLTACEWDQDDGECWAYVKEVTVGGKSTNTLCYRFNNEDQPYVGRKTES